MKLNDDKTEFLIIDTDNKINKVNFNDIKVGDTHIRSNTKAKNLGVIFDNHMNLKSQVNNMCKTGYFHVRNLANIRKYLDKDTANIAAHAFITSNLDYGNSLLYGIAQNLIDKLQRVQNAAARMVTKTKKYDHITAIRKELHWLPVKARIEFKILTMTWKSINGAAPQYLSDLIVDKTVTRSLRSDNKNLLHVPVTSLKTCGDRAFCKAAPTLWNKLPQKIRGLEKIESFKKNLKTHLFQTYYI